MSAPIAKYEHRYHLKDIFLVVCFIPNRWFEALTMYTYVKCICPEASECLYTIALQWRCLLVWILAIDEFEINRALI